MDKTITKTKNWDSYFMDIADVVKTRSDCLTRSVGAVLINKRNRIIATGYNGAPRGLKNCNEGGCERCSAKIAGKIQSGEQLDKCICVHAEENAILQSAYDGTSTKDTVLYCTVLYYPVSSALKFSYKQARKRCFIKKLTVMH